MAKNRERIDYALFLAEEPCDMGILGDEDELLKFAIQHAVHEHGQRDTPALREELRSLVHHEREKLKAA
jgi:uncharacterized protein DUF1059